jgi:hypothetical protein
MGIAMATIIKSASVKVMLSYNYNHFEASLNVENDEGLSMTDVDNARKECQRLCDKAVIQYQKSKNHEANRARNAMEKRALEKEVSEIRAREQSTWSITDKAKVKALEDHNWELKWDYGDDDEDYKWN